MTDFVFGLDMRENIFGKGTRNLEEKAEKFGRKDREIWKKTKRKTNFFAISFVGKAKKPIALEIPISNCRWGTIETLRNWDILSDKIFFVKSKNKFFSSEDMLAKY